jgi:four helix bundle protein
MIQTNFRTYELAVELYQNCGRLRAKGEIRNQLERASLSAVLNLSEGAAKPTKADKRRFYAIAYGSIRETQTILRLLNELDLYKKADALGASAYKLIQSTK